MKRAALPALLVAAVSVAVAIACRDDVASPDAAGSISIQIVLSDDAATDLAGRVPAPTSDFVLFGRLDAARAHARGPTNRTVNLTQSPSGDSFSGTIDGLPAGTYTVIVEGLIDGQVDYYGETGGVTVSAGQDRTATIPFASFRPAITSLPEQTVSRAFEVCFSSVPSAESYRVEWAGNLDFTGLSSATGAGTCVAVEVSEYGKHYVRVRAINSTVTSGGRPGDPDSVDVLAASVGASGTLMEASETEIRQGGATLILTLTDDTWASEVGGDNPVTRGLLDGIDSQEAEVRGWDAVVKAGLSFNDVARISATEVRITLPPFPEYDISSPETITPTVPAPALAESVDDLTAQTSFQIAVIAGSAQLAGTVTDDSELEVRGGGSTLVLTLMDDSWVPEVGGDNAITRALLDGLVSDGAEVAGWNAVVTPGLTAADVQRVSATDVEILLPAFPGYDIAEPEQVTATVPASALAQSQNPLTASPSFSIVAAPGLAVQLTGSGTVTSEPAGITCPDDCGEEFPEGTMVTLTGQPDAFWTFGGWGGACAGVTEPVCDVQMNGSQTVSATFTQETYDLSLTVTGAGSVASVPAGIACPGDCAETYPGGTALTLTATADPLWHFARWGDACAAATGPVCDLVMTQAQNVSLTFVRDTFTLSVEVAGMGSVSSDPVGIDCPGDCSEDYASQTSVMLTAAPDPGWHLSTWEGDCSGTALTVSVAMDKASLCRAVFAQDTYDLNVTVTGNGSVASGDGGIACPDDCTETYPSGTVLSVTATADPLWHFSAWGGACAGAKEPDCIVVMSQARDVSATFVRDTFQLTTTVTGMGTLTSDPPGIVCPGDCNEPFPSETPVMVFQLPVFGWTFGGWGGDCTGVGPCDVVMTQMRSVSALFAGPRWIDLKPTGGPPAGRARHTAVYLEATNQMVVFGGLVATGKTNDVWILHDATGTAGAPTWQLVVPGGDPPPPARDGHSAVYDPVSDRMIVFGGSAEADQFFFNDLWALEGVMTGDPIWIQLLPDGAVPPRHGHTAVYNPTTNQMVVFGGRSAETGLVTNEVWVLSNANGIGGVPTWRQITPPNGPRPRLDGAAVYDPNTNRMTVFAGSDPDNGVTYDDVWVLIDADGNGNPAWQLPETMGQPPSARAGHSAVYHPNTNIMTVYGPNGELWVLLDANGVTIAEWRALVPEDPQAPARESHTAVYDVRSNRMVVFGGLVGGSLANDVWTLTRPNGFSP